MKPKELGQLGLKKNLIVSCFTSATARIGPAFLLFGIFRIFAALCSRAARLSLELRTLGFDGSAFPLSLQVIFELGYIVESLAGYETAKRLFQERLCARFG
jgi:hypothetical protein